MLQTRRVSSSLGVGAFGADPQGRQHRLNTGETDMKVVRMLVGLVASTTLLLGTGLAAPELGSAALVAPASSKAKVSYPKKGQTSVAVYRLQQRLVLAKALKAKDKTGHYNTATVAAVKRFQTTSRLHRAGKIDAATWAALVRATPGATPKVTIPGLDKRCRVHGRAICIDKTLRKLYYVKNSHVLQIMDTRFGCRSTPTREGRFRIVRKSRYHTSSLFHVYMPYAMFFHGGQAVHWSKAFTKHGYHGCSHGCVNIRDMAGVRWLFDQMRVGDRIVIYRS